MQEARTGTAPRLPNAASEPDYQEMETEPYAYDGSPTQDPFADDGSPTQNPFEDVGGIGLGLEGAQIQREFFGFGTTAPQTQACVRTTI
jgi:hypothetical protein